MKCELGKVSFPPRPFSHALLRGFYERFKNSSDGIPTCSLCEFRMQCERTFSREGIDLYSESQRETFKNNKGYVKQAERLEREIKRGETTPSCQVCVRLGFAMPRRANRSFCTIAAVGAHEGLMVCLLQKRAAD